MNEYSVIPGHLSSYLLKRQAAQYILLAQASVLQTAITRSLSQLRSAMYITVKYGNNESLLCNPSCAVVNLLHSIKRRTGYSNANVLLDLSDETGLVKDLDIHQRDYATKYLASHGTYVLVEKQLLLDDASVADTDSVMSAPPQYQYIPLLDNYTELFPNYRLHVQNVEKKTSKKVRNQSKSPSPAGVRGIKGRGRSQPARAPSRKK